MCFKRKNPRKPIQGTAVDPQTDQEYELDPEDWVDVFTAYVSVGYSLIVMFFFLWLLFDIWSRAYRCFSLFPWLTSLNKDAFNSTTFRLIAYTFIGGSLGGTITSMRSIIGWHCEKGAFGGRFLLKHISQPWVGGVLALFIFAIVRGGVGILGGEFANQTSGTTMLKQALTTFGLGLLSGYGSHQVYKWIDSQVNKIFHVESGIKDPNLAKVPDLIGKTLKEAEDLLKKTGLKIGKNDARQPKQNEKIETIVEQKPLSGVSTEGVKEVDITIART
jgi:hypothetical protein